VIATLIPVKGGLRRQMETPQFAQHDHTVDEIYALDVRELLNVARRHVTRTFTADECQRYFESATCPPMP
jgi:hypothetical protein